MSNVTRLKSVSVRSLSRVEKQHLFQAVGGLSRDHPDILIETHEAGQHTQPPENPHD